jgi:hypothetical protein
MMENAKTYTKDDAIEMLLRVSAAQGLGRMLQESNPESKRYAEQSVSIAVAVENLLAPVVGFLDYVNVQGRLPGKNKRSRGGKA